MDIARLTDPYDGAAMASVSTTHILSTVCRASRTKTSNVSSHAGSSPECRHDEVTLVVFGAPYSPSIATISTAGVALVLNTLPPSAEPRLMFAPLRTVTRTMPARAVHLAP